MNDFKYLLFLAFTAILFAANPISASAQTCKGFEQELEAYFMEYQPGMNINSGMVENLRARCPQPTEKMEMIYFYLMAENAFDAYKTGSRKGLEDARYFFGQAQQFFPSLDQMQLYEPDFVKAYVGKAYALEDELAGSYAAGSPTVPANTQGRGISGARSATPTAVANPAADNWDKPVLHPVKKQAMQGRGISPNPATPEGDFQTRGIQTRSVALREVKDNNDDDGGGDKYGLVGDLGDIPVYEYSDYIAGYFGAQTAEATPAGNGGTATRSISAARSINPHSSRKVMGTAVCMWDEIRAFENPGMDSKELMVLEFGDQMTRTGETEFVEEENSNYSKVRLPNGQYGWVDDYYLSHGGKLGVVLNEVSTYKSINGGNNALAGKLEVGELVLIERVDQGWAEVNYHQNEAPVWIKSLSVLSMDEREIEIARSMHRAMHEPTPTLRRAKLEEITRKPNYKSSQLTGAIEAAISETYLNAGDAPATGMRTAPANQSGTVYPGGTATRAVNPAYPTTPPPSNARSLTLPSNTRSLSTDYRSAGTQPRGVNPTGSAQQLTLPYPLPSPTAAGAMERSDFIRPDQELAGNRTTVTLGEVEAKLRKGLADAGYEKLAWFEIPGGFALVSQPEMIRQDAAPVKGDLRWGTINELKGNPTFMQYMVSNLPLSPGTYRFFIFSVSSKDSDAYGSNYPVGPTATRSTWPQTDTPSRQEISQSNFSQNHEVRASVYLFRRSQKGQPAAQMFLPPSKDFDVETRLHLQKSEIWIPPSL